jgi:hypothetical protein
MNTTDQKLLSSHTTERTLFQVQVRRRKGTSPSIALNEKLIGEEWEPVPLPPRAYYFTDHFDTAAELHDGLFPYALAMREAWDVLSVEHARVFEVRLVPHLVKSSYASFPQEPMPELERNPS